VQMNDCITRNIFTNISKGLFEAHKRVFAFLLCTSIQRNANLIPDGIWNLFLRGAGASVQEGTNEIPNPDKILFSKQGWAMIQQLSSLYFTKLSILPFVIKEKIKIWKDYSQAENIYDEPLPGDLLLLDQKAYEKVRPTMNSMLEFRHDPTMEVRHGASNKFEEGKQPLGNYFFK
jgi:hypothetical protein